LGIALTGISVAGKEPAMQPPAGKMQAAQPIQHPHNGRNTTNQFTNGGINLNAKHTISKKQDLSVDLDLLKYTIQNDQSFQQQTANSTGIQKVH
jgi:hypothetical protein